MTSTVTRYTTRLLTPDTWDDFAALVEANNGVWGGCWCIGFHPEGISRNSTAAGNREAKLTHVNNGTIHQILVYRDGRCVGWCQYGPPAEVATIKNPKTYEKGLAELPDWRIGCLFTGSGSRRQGVARAGVAAVLAAIVGGRLVDRFGPRLMLFPGLLLMGLSTWQLAGITLTTSYTWLVLVLAVRGLGLGYLRSEPRQCSHQHTGQPAQTCIARCFRTAAIAGFESCRSGCLLALARAFHSGLHRGLFHPGSQTRSSGER